MVANLTITSNGTTSSLGHNDKQWLDCLDCPDTYISSFNQGMDQKLDAKAQLIPQMIAAITVGDEGLVQLLLDLQAKLNFGNLGLLLVKAVKARHEIIVQLLLDQGVNTNVLHPNHHQQINSFAYRHH